MSNTRQILGLRFHDGNVSEVVQAMSRGGVLVVPAAPALVRLQNDEIYRDAMLSADLAIPDSGLMVLVWKILGRGSLTRISGLTYLKRLFEARDARQDGKFFFVLPSEAAKNKLLKWSEEQGLSIQSDQCYVAPLYSREVTDSNLLMRLDQRQPAHLVIAIGNGPQEKLGVYLRNRLNHRPAIHCVGAALGFLTGDQVAIPDWADRLYLGWLLRLFAQPGVFIPRLSRSLVVPWLIFRYGEKMPPLRGGKVEIKSRK